MFRLLPLALLALSMTLPACGSSNDDESSTGSPAPRRHIEEADSPAYCLGRGEGLRLVDCQTQEEICDRLLDLRAREHIIRTQIRPSAAEAYIQGIEDAVECSGDTLIRIFRP